MEEVNLETRVLLLEKEMEWNRTDRQSFKEDFQALKEGMDKLTFHMIEIHKDLGDSRAQTDERISNLQAHTDERISALQAHTDERISALQAHTDERISALQAHTDERISALQAHTDERISNLQAHTDERFSALQAHTDAGFVEVNRELSSIHQAISIQTRWILAALLALLSVGTMISFGLPLALKLVDRLVP